MIFLDMYIMGCVLRFEHGGFNTSVYGNLRHMMIDYQPFPSSLQQAYQTVIFHSYVNVYQRVDEELNL